MENNKLFRIISISLLGLSALMSIYFFLTDFNDADATSSATGIFIILCYIFFGIAIVAALGFSVLGMIQNPKKAKSALIGVGVLVLICAIGYFMSGSEEHITLEGKVLADAGTSQLSGGGLVAFYILAVVAVGSIIFAEVSKLFK